MQKVHLSKIFRSRKVVQCYINSLGDSRSGEAEMGRERHAAASIVATGGRASQKPTRSSPEKIARLQLVSTVFLYPESQLLQTLYKHWLVFWSHGHRVIRRPIRHSNILVTQQIGRVLPRTPGKCPWPQMKNPPQHLHAEAGFYWEKRLFKNLSPGSPRLVSP